MRTFKALLAFLIVLLLGATVVSAMDSSKEEPAENPQSTLHVKDAPLP